MYDVVTIGSATRDAFVASRDFRVIDDVAFASRKALAMPLGAKIEVSDMVFSTGGGATNAAVTFVRQGLRTATVAAVGEDVSGRAVLEELRGEGVETKFIARRRDFRTGYSILLHPEGSGERTVLVYRGASDDLQEEGIPWDDMITRWFYCSSVSGNFDLLKRVLAAAKERGAAVAYNPGGRELKESERLTPLLQGVDVLIVNREEAALITGAPFERELEIFKKWDVLTPGRNINVMTDARNGVLVSDGTLLYKAGIFSDTGVKDRTGAGDAFGSGFVAGLIRRLAERNVSVGEAVPDDIEYAIRLGSANATAKVEGIGAKYGLLTRDAFEKDERWSDFSITKTPIS